MTNNGTVNQQNRLAHLKSGWREASHYVHEIAAGQGFWNEGDQRHPTHPIALAMSELGEALECYREGGFEKPDKNIAGRSGVEVQLGDVLGILMDMSEGYGLDLVGAMLDKMEFNKSRGYLHGKRY